MHFFIYLNFFFKLMQDLLLTGFDDYALIDSGCGEKLERFGRYVLRRPEPQAVWDRAMSENEWMRSAQACFKRDARGDDRGGAERGFWQLRPGMPEQWQVGYAYKDMALRFRLGLTSFKHVGLFPEQAVNWNFIYDEVARRKKEDARPPEVLNLFAYTGGASLAARAAGAVVTHVDSVRQVIAWSRENMESSHLSDIRWVVEDAVKFVHREVKRGHRYQGVILDPPAYGRGPAGEKWVLEAGILDMMQACRMLLDDHAFCVLNLYSMGFSPMIAANLLQPLCATSQCGTLYVCDAAGRNLPLGVYARGIR